MNQRLKRSCGDLKSVRMKTELFIQFQESAAHLK